MTLKEKAEMLHDIFDIIMLAPGRKEKEEIVNTFVPLELKQEFEHCIDVLSGKHKLGYRLFGDYSAVGENLFCTDNIIVLTEYLKSLSSSYRDVDIACRTIRTLVEGDSYAYEFFWYLYNREFRLGIGKSLLTPAETAPMLAELYNKKDRRGTYYITQKLDGVRCISYYDGSEWHFVSRNGRPLSVSFDMSSMNTDYIYDGELLIPGHGFHYVDGVVNSINHKDKDAIVYNIFDMYSNENNFPYKQRREMLDKLITGNRVTIVPLLSVVTLPQDEDTMMQIFLDITSKGGEGIMLNEENAHYMHKRGSHILKLKDTITMDMWVVGVKEGQGKYEGMIGSLECEAYDEKYDKMYHTFCGGLSDEDRLRFDWIGKLIEVQCNGVTQNANTKGTKEYSIRHARYIRTREDKSSSSTN